MSTSLKKGQRITLIKQGTQLDHVCIGVTWGAVEKKGFFGKKKKLGVYLDASAGLFDEDNKVVDIVCFSQLKSKCESVFHGAYNLTDLGGDDVDNEVMRIDLSGVPAHIASIAVVINSFHNQVFGSIPFARIRLFEGAPDHVDHVIADYNITNSDVEFSDVSSMVLGLLCRHGNEWIFTAVGETTSDKRLEHTMGTVAREFLVDLIA